MVMMMVAVMMTIVTTTGIRMKHVVMAKKMGRIRVYK